MGLYEDLKEQAVNLLCTIHMRNALNRDNKTSILEGLFFVENSLDDMKRDIVQYYEEQILNSDEILPESTYKSLLSYYNAIRNNADVINKILSQSKKNKFKKYDSSATILSASELEKRLG